MVKGNRKIDRVIVDNDERCLFFTLWKACFKQFLAADWMQCVGEEINDGRFNAAAAGRLCDDRWELANDTAEVN